MYDVVVVGGGVAGLSAALILGRARRGVLVLNGGTPRNAPAQRAHGFVSRDGIPPLEMLRLARAELGAYPSFEVMDVGAAGASATTRGFGLTLTDGQTIEARKILLASGVIDELPEIPGMAELWGDGVYHCPYCHGWEIRDKPWAILGDSPLIFERVALFRSWASKLVVLANGPSSVSTGEKERLAILEVPVDERRVAQLERNDQHDVKVTFEDGSNLVFGGIFILPHQEQRSKLAEALGCEMDEFLPTATQYVKADPASGETTVRGVYAVGDMSGPTQSLVLAAASGARAAYRMNHAMAMEDAEAFIVSAGRNDIGGLQVSPGEQASLLDPVQ